MSKLYRDYIWKDGIPYGIGICEGSDSLYYKISMDPYRKRIALEMYEDSQFKKIIYDSALLNFRHLNPEEQAAWQKVVVSETDQQHIAAIYNQDDRLILFETYHFENTLCRSCKATSAHGIPLYEQKMFYKLLDDEFDGVILFDNHNRPVVLKRYAFDESQGEFTELLEEINNGSLIFKEWLDRDKKQG